MSVWSLPQFPGPCFYRIGSILSLVMGDGHDLMWADLTQTFTHCTGALVIVPNHVIVPNRPHKPLTSWPSSPSTRLVFCSLITESQPCKSVKEIDLS